MKYIAYVYYSGSYSFEVDTEDYDTEDASEIKRMIRTDESFRNDIHGNLKDIVISLVEKDNGQDI